MNQKEAHLNAIKAFRKIREGMRTSSNPEQAINSSYEPDVCCDIVTAFGFEWDYEVYKEVRP